MIIETGSDCAMCFHEIIGVPVKNLLFCPWDGLLPKHKQILILSLFGLMKDA